MIYQTVALHYVRIVNYEVYDHALRYARPPPKWSCSTLRSGESRSGSWDVIRDGKLAVPLDEWMPFWDRRTDRMWG
jgi:hypothetical protein